MSVQAHFIRRYMHQHQGHKLICTCKDPQSSLLHASITKHQNGVASQSLSFDIHESDLRGLEELKGYKASYFGQALKPHILSCILSAVLIIFQHIVNVIHGYYC